MYLYRYILKYRVILTIVLALMGIGLMAFYAVCDTSCSYLKGDIFGIDLKYIGVAYMTCIILLGLFKQTDLVRMLLASGIGVEIFLVYFQFKENVFCPFCLTFGVMVILMYIINCERSPMKDKWYSKIIYIFGDAKIPFISNVRIPLLAFMILGYLFVTFAFSGSATPAYAAEKSKVPSYGKGVWELVSSNAHGTGIHFSNNSMKG